MVYTSAAFIRKPINVIFFKMKIENPVTLFGYFFKPQYNIIFTEWLYNLTLSYYIIYKHIIITGHN